MTTRPDYVKKAQKEYYERVKKDPIRYANRLKKEREARQRRNKEKKEENIEEKVVIYTCSCGSSFNIKNKRKHEKTKKHIKFIEEKNL